MFKVLPVTAGSFAGLWSISRTDCLAGFIGCFESIQKVRAMWLAQGLKEEA